MTGPTGPASQPTRNLMMLSVGTTLVAAVGWISGWAYISEQLWFEEPVVVTTTYVGDPLLGRALVPAMTAVTATDGDRSAALAFTTPDSAVAIDGYELQVNGGEWESLDDSRVVDGLSNGDTYTFRVRAVSRATRGEPSRPSNAVVPYRSPDRPRNLKAETVRTKIVWTWDEPPKMDEN